MSQTAPSHRDGDRLLGASASRTLFLRHPPGGTPEVWKLLLRGSLADAEREARLTTHLTPLGVAQCLGAALDPTSGRPCVRTVAHGTDLHALMGRQGALPATEACRIVARAAEVAHALHQHRSPELPSGIVHCDLKPSNLLWDGAELRVLDLEHARPLGGSAAPGSFTGGTIGFAPPEAHRGAAPTPAFDVYALGATLVQLLTGGCAQVRCLAGSDPRVVDLALACMHEDAARRPAANELARELQLAAARLLEDPAEHALDLALRGRTEDAIAAARGLADAGRRQAITDRARRLQALRSRRQPPTEPCADGSLAAITREVRALDAWLRRVPRDQALLALREGARARAMAALMASPELAQGLADDLEHERAGELLDAASALAETLAGTTGPIPLPASADPLLVPPMLAQPVATLRALRERIRADAARHASDMARLEAEEAALDLAACEAVVDEIGRQHGGATGTTSRLRDRQHRLAFYLERITRSRDNLERASQLAPDLPLDHMATLVNDCRRAVEQAAGGGDTRPQGAMGLRNLQLALVNVAADFPHMAQRTEAPLRQLDALLARLSDEAVRVLEEAQSRLAATPVPVKVLQTMLARLDLMRTLDAFVDRPHGSRTALLDRLENLRMRLDQARATRDRLASGAEQALARGHWTTGLFDMERAVRSMADGDEGTEGIEARRLQERLAEARRRKQEIEAATRRNVELAARCASLADDARSTHAERLQALRERRDVLQFLGIHVPADRSALYTRDLRDVEAAIAQEEATDAEARLDRCEDPARRLAIARETLALLHESQAMHESGIEPSGRIVRLVEHWQSLTQHAEREVQRQLEEAARARRRRQLRRTAVVILAVAATGIVAALLARG